MISRTGYTGELGYEIWCHPSDAPVDGDGSRQKRRVNSAGFGALDLLRIEAGLILFGNEFDDRLIPLKLALALQYH